MPNTFVVFGGNGSKDENEDSKMTAQHHRCGDFAFSVFVRRDF